jgi:hypothetical protein
MWGSQRRVKQLVKDKEIGGAVLRSEGFVLSVRKMRLPGSYSSDGSYDEKLALDFSSISL